MNQAEYSAQLTTIFNLAALVRHLKVYEVRRLMARAETVGPILDPTLFRMVSSSLKQQKEIIEVTLEYQRAIEGILEKYEADANGS